MSIKSCRFCNIASGQQAYGNADRPIKSSENYLAIPSIGAFIEGWVLIIPKKHDLSLSHHYGLDEFLKFSTEVEELVRAKYGSCILFEHGANKEGSLTGCGVDHAHFHIVPYEASLIDFLYQDGSVWEQLPKSRVSEYVGKNEYLLYSDSSSKLDGDVLVHILEKPKSQFFRKLLAEQKSYLELSDYKTHLHISKSTNTFEVLSL